MTVRIGINGFGRMGRLVLRAGWQSSGWSFVHVNETKGGIGAAAHLLAAERGQRYAGSPWRHPP
jgi:glyceraldehyde-3-phosphate dehydrogenase (arsenate-transferring)